MNPTFSDIRDNYLSLIHHYQVKESPVPRNDILILLCFAGIFSLIGIITYLTGGYHAGFIEINSATPYIPNLLLQNTTVFGDGALLLPLVLLFFNRNIQVHWTIFFAALSCAILSNLLKDYFGLSRPAGVLALELFNTVGPVYKAGSFPSGHILTAFAMASICFCNVRSSSLKYLFLLIATLVGLSRILIGVHWPIDILAGGALGILIGVSSVVITLKWKVGLRAPIHLFTFFILIASCLIVFINGNDYQLALPLLYFVSAAALTQTYDRYVLSSLPSLIPVKL